MAGTRKGRAKAVNETAGQLLAALKFTSIGNKTVADNPAAACTAFMNGYAVSFDGVIEAAYPIPGADIEGFVNTKLMIDALGNVGKELELSSLEDSIYIKSGDFEVSVPTLPASQITAGPPDPQAYPLDNKFRDALALVGRPLKDTAENYVSAAILSTGPSVISAYEKTCIAEAYHACNMPPAIVYPKAFANALMKADKNLVGFGYTGGNTLTVWFEDGSFIRTQLYSEPFPLTVGQLQQQFSTIGAVIPLPTGTLAAVDAVKPFAKANKIAFRSGAVVADPFFTASGLLEWNASKEVKALPDSPCFNANFFTAYADVCPDMSISADRLFMVTPGGATVPLRVVFARMQEPVDSQPPEQLPEETPEQYANRMAVLQSGDIPF